MPRKSQRISSGSAKAAQHKRAASNTHPASLGSKRSKSTPTRSQYFSGDSDQQGLPDDKESKHEELSSTDSDHDDDASEFGNSDEKSASEGDGEDDYDSNSDEAPKKRSKGAGLMSTASAAPADTKGGEIWRNGVKAGLGPGKQVIIKKPKARPAGKTPYQDDTIHPNTFLFLKDLKAHNDRNWWVNDPEFRQAEKDWFSFVEKISEKLSEIDDTVPELPVKDVIFRIYRDVRFSKDPTPYKAHFSAAWSRTGRKGPYGHYYVQLSPGNASFIGGGLWHPESAPTQLIRHDIDRHPRRIKDVLLDERLRQEFLGSVGKSDAKAVKAFVSANAENALKTRPKGYDADRPDIDLLRLRNYTIGRKLDEAEVVGPHGLDRIAELLSCMKPFITYLNSVVMPDDPGSEDGEEAEDGGLEEAASSDDDGSE